MLIVIMNSYKEHDQVCIHFHGFGEPELVRVRTVHRCQPHNNLHWCFAHCLLIIYFVKLIDKEISIENDLL